MNEPDQMLRRALADALRSKEPAATPPFPGLWAAAQRGRERQPGIFSGWADAVTAGVAVASVIAIGIFIAAGIHQSDDDATPDTALYSQLVAQTTWTSPTDSLLDAHTRFPLAGLPALPAVNTNPSLESLL